LVWRETKYLEAFIQNISWEEENRHAETAGKANLGINIFDSPKILDVGRHQTIVDIYLQNLEVFVISSFTLEQASNNFLF